MTPPVAANPRRWPARAFLRGVMLQGSIAAVILVGRVAASPPDYSKNCTDAGCHAKLIKFKTVHAPVDGGCDACHEPVEGEAHKFKWTTEPEKLCFECHDAFKGKVVHQPVANAECTSCHNPHGSNQPHLLQGDSQVALCKDCHDSIGEGMKYLHGPVSASCTACHDPHATEHRALLNETGPPLCLQCHESIKQSLEEKAFKHDPVTDDCLTCHNPHGGGDPFNLTAGPPGLCLDCHDDVGEAVEEAVAKHDVVTTGRSCMNCHNPHASAFDGLLIDKPMNTCMSCHDKDQVSPDGNVPALAELMQSGAQPHGPVADGDCTGCHQPHGGANFRMLVGKYPPSFYAPFEEGQYGLCFECHEASAFASAKTKEETNFRNGEQNLHFLHVHRSKKGRTCRACHAPHASRSPFHLADAVRFGSWKLPLNFVKEPNGGSCQPGCHRLYRYDRNEPVANLPDLRASESATN